MVDVQALVEAMTLEEKASLTAGEDALSCHAVARLGIPKIRMTDGPSGARGGNFPGLGGPTSTCVPSASSVGATWDADIAERVGAIVGREALDRGCRVLLAPTVNLHRFPLAGRNFECYSEDPLLTGQLAAGYARGVQSRGVVATVKHLVGNEAETHRNWMSSAIDERALRELYLLPFERVIRDGGALAVMTSYNRLNGTWVTEQRGILTDILRGEWGFAGMVMTDWWGVADTVRSMRAGLDLEMPGPGRAFGQTLVRAIRDGLVDEADLDGAVTNFLTALDRVCAFDGPPPEATPVPLTIAERAFLRHAAAEGTVLLTNDGILPLSTSQLRKVAIIGAHASAPAIVGGGAAEVVTDKVVTPLEALVDALGGQVTLVHARGCEPDQKPPVVGTSALLAPNGFDVEVYAGDNLDGELIERRHLDDFNLVSYDLFSFGLAGGWKSVRVSGTVVAQDPGPLDLTLTVRGRARLFVDGVLSHDGMSMPLADQGSDTQLPPALDVTRELVVEAGSRYELTGEFFRTELQPAGFRVGARTLDSDALLDRAVAAAQDADVAVLFVGTSAESETEMQDRLTFALPGRQDELVRRVAEVNPRTVVVVNAGSPVDLPWTDDVAAVVQCWFAGQEMGPAIAEVLTGLAEPGGRLPTTIPERLEHSPSFDNFPGENGEVRYGEGLFMGYRGFERKAVAPRFPFGHGLSYTQMDFGTPTVSSHSTHAGASVSVRMRVANVGERFGSEVVQLYVAPESPRLQRPIKELKAFRKVRLSPGESTEVELVLDARAFAYWDPGVPGHEQLADRLGTSASIPTAPAKLGWQVDPGRYGLLIGRSSQDIVARLTVDLT